MSKHDRISKIAPLISQILEILGEDPTRQGLKSTSVRVANTLSYLTNGYHFSPEKVLNGALFKYEGEELIVVGGVEFYSLCEHHMLPFFGKAHVGYIPNGQIIGLSKVARVIDIFARRLQVQERMTRDIACALIQTIGSSHVAVVTEARHTCMMMRGVEKQGSTTVVSSLNGDFRTDSSLRQDFNNKIVLGDLF